MTETNDPAKARFIALSAMRVIAALLILAGVVMAFGNRVWIDSETDRIAGFILIAVGFFDLLVLMPMLVRRWKSKD